MRTHTREGRGVRERERATQREREREGEKERGREARECVRGGNGLHEKEL